MSSSPFFPFLILLLLSLSLFLSFSLFYIIFKQFKLLGIYLLLLVFPSTSVCFSFRYFSSNCYPIAFFFIIFITFELQFICCFFAVVLSKLFTVRDACFPQFFVIIFFSLNFLFNIFYFLYIIDKR